MTTVCTDSGWVPRPERMRCYQCSPPPDPRDGHWDCDLTQQNTMVCLLQCNPGHTLSGPHIVQCSEDSTPFTPGPASSKCVPLPRGPLVSGGVVGAPDGPCLPPPDVPGGTWRCNPVTGECLLDCLSGHTSPAPVAARCCSHQPCHGWISTNIGIGCSRTHCRGEDSGERQESSEDNGKTEDKEEKDVLTEFEIKQLEIPKEDGPRELIVAATEETIGDGEEEIEEEDNEIRIFEKEEEVIDDHITSKKKGKIEGEETSDVVDIPRENDDGDPSVKTEDASEQGDDTDKKSSKNDDGKDRGVKKDNEKNKEGDNLASYEEMFGDSNADFKDSPGDGSNDNESEVIIERETLEQKVDSAEDTSLEKELEITDHDDSNSDEHTSLEKEIKNGESEGDKNYEKEDESIESSSSGEGEEVEDGSGNHFVTEMESSYNGYGYDYSTIKYQGQSSNLQFTKEMPSFDFFSELESEESSGGSEVVNDFSRFRKTIHSKTESNEDGETEHSARVDDIR